MSTVPVPVDSSFEACQPNPINGNIDIKTAKNHEVKIWHVNCVLFVEWLYVRGEAMLIALSILINVRLRTDALQKNRVRTIITLQLSNLFDHRLPEVCTIRKGAASNDTRISDTARLAMRKCVLVRKFVNLYVAASVNMLPAMDKRRIINIPITISMLSMSDIFEWR